MCSCNQNLHKDVCRLIGGDGVLIVGVYLGLLLLSGAFFHIVEGGSLYLNKKVPLLRGY